MKVVEQDLELGESREAQAVPPGYKRTEVGVIPVEWEVKPIGKLAAAIAAGKSSAFDEGEGAPIYGSTGKIGNSRKKDYSGPRILVARVGANAGLTYIVDGEYSVTDNTLMIRCGEQIEFDLLYHQVVKCDLNQYVFGSGQPLITGGQLKAIEIPLPPSPKEQTAIATALSDADALIQSLEKLIAKKKSLKRGAMRELLTGKTRLPGFETKKGYQKTEVGVIPADWKVKELGAMLSSAPRYGINAPAVILTGELPVYLRITDISEDGYFLPDTKVGVDSPYAHEYFLEEGDVVFARTGASVGKSYLYRKADGRLVYAGFLIRVSPNPALLDSNYLSQYVKTLNYWNWVAVMSMRSGQPGINGQEYAQLPLSLPPTKAEQTAIAQTLSDMDAEIAALQAKRDKYKALKQGMMQQLLTGKIRLV